MKSLFLAASVVAAAMGTAQAGPQVQMQINGDTLRPLIQEHNMQVRMYYEQVEQIIVHKVRNIRVAQERNDISETGHPVKLPTGWCSAIVSIQPDGTVTRTELGRCQHAALGEILKKAISEASPLPAPGQTYNMTVSVDAPVPTPGYLGN